MFEKLFGHEESKITEPGMSTEEEKKQSASPGRIDERTGIVLTPEEIKKERERKESNPNWFREQS